MTISDRLWAGVAALMAFAVLHGVERIATGLQAHFWGIVP